MPRRYLHLPCGHRGRITATRRVRRTQEPWAPTLYRVEHPMRRWARDIGVWVVLLAIGVSLLAVAVTIGLRVLIALLG